jgi:hypothetical protein
VQTANPNAVDPPACVTGVLELIVLGRTEVNKLHTLLPWNRTPPAPQAVSPIQPG